LEYGAQTFQNFLCQIRKFNATVINDGPTDGPQNSIGNVCRTGDLQKMAAGANHIIDGTAENTPATRMRNSPKTIHLQNIPASKRVAKTSVVRDVAAPQQ
jgi:hypothetical protein